MSDTIVEPMSLEEKVEKLLNLLEGKIAVEPEVEPDLPPELVIYLDPPIKGPMEKEYDSLVLRQPTVDEFRKARAKSKGKDDPDFEFACALIRLVSGSHDEVVNKLPWESWSEASEYLTGFLLRGRKTSKS